MPTLREVKKLGLVMFVVLGAGLLAGMTAGKTQTAYTDLFNPFGLPNPMGVPAIGQFLDPGKVICPGQTPTANPMQPCPEGSGIIARGARAYTRIEAEDPAMAGWMTLELNGNFAPDYTGPVWGELYIQLDAGGVWEGTWNGIRERQAGESIWTAELRVVLHGLGGDVNGQQAKCTELITALTAMPILYKGVATCRVLNPGEQ